MGEYNTGGLKLGREPPRVHPKNGESKCRGLPEFQILAWFRFAIWHLYQFPRRAGILRCRFSLVRAASEDALSAKFVKMFTPRNEPCPSCELRMKHDSGNQVWVSPARGVVSPSTLTEFFSIRYWVSASSPLAALERRSVSRSSINCMKGTAKPQEVWAW